VFDRAAGRERWSAAWSNLPELLWLSRCTFGRGALGNFLTEDRMAKAKKRTAKKKARKAAKKKKLAGRKAAARKVVARRKAAKKRPTIKSARRKAAKKKPAVRKKAAPRPAANASCIRSPGSAGAPAGCNSGRLAFPNGQQAITLTTPAALLPPKESRQGTAGVGSGRPTAGRQRYRISPRSASKDFGERSAGARAFWITFLNQ